MPQCDTGQYNYMQCIYVMSPACAEGAGSEQLTDRQTERQTASWRFSCESEMGVLVDKGGLPSFLEVEEGVIASRTSDGATPWSAASLLKTASIVEIFARVLEDLQLAYLARDDAERAVRYGDMKTALEAAWFQMQHGQRGGAEQDVGGVD